MLMVILWWQRIAFFGRNLSATPRAAIDTRMGRFIARAMQRVKRRVSDADQKVLIFV
jgi:hypothetical protein